MKVFRWICGSVLSLAIVMVVCVTMIQMVCFDSDWYKEEYTKYNIYEEVNMESAELHKVTDKMIGYLSGEEEELQVSAIVDGKTRDFFNEKELEHMKDVKHIFDMLLRVRNIFLFSFMIAGIYYLFALRNGMSLMDYMPIPFAVIGLIIILAMTAGYVMVSFNFSGVFTTFHEILFTNNLWILNPETDLLIRILPEGFFMDTAMKMVIRLAIVGVVSLVLLPVLTYMRYNYKACKAEAEENFKKNQKGKIKVDY